MYAYTPMIKFMVQLDITGVCLQNVIIIIILIVIIIIIIIIVRENTG